MEVSIKSLGTHQTDIFISISCHSKKYRFYFLIFDNVFEVSGKKIIEYQIYCTFVLKIMALDYELTYEQPNIIKHN